MPRVCERHVFRIQVSECLIVNIVFRLEEPLVFLAYETLKKILCAQTKLIIVIPTIKVQEN